MFFSEILLDSCTSNVALLQRTSCTTSSATFVDREGGGPQRWIINGVCGGGGWAGCSGLIRKFLNVNIINFQIVDKTRRGDQKKVFLITY